VAELQLEGGELVLHLSGAEKAEAVHGDLRVPVSSAVLTAVHHAPSKVVMTRDCSCRFSDPTTCAVIRRWNSLAVLPFLDPVARH
jgi:hypothetical protein